MHRDVVDAVAAVAGALGGRRDEVVAQFSGGDERDLRARGDGDRPVRVAGEGESGVGQQEHVTAVGDVVPVDHRLGDLHRGHRPAVGRFDEFDAEGAGRLVGVEHGVRGVAGHELALRDGDLLTEWPVIPAGAQ